MFEIIIKITDVEAVALAHVTADPQEWAQNAVTERARIAAEEIVTREMARMIADPNITQIPATSAEIIMAAELPPPPSTKLPIPSEA